jgi:microcin C transport system permease protein
MGAYILRRLLLIVPTIFGIMLVNFALTQFVPGGPIEQVLAQIEGQGDVFAGFAGGGGGPVEAGGESEGYIGARGLPPEFIAELEREFGFDKPPVERFLQMMGNYLRFDFGESYFRSVSVTDLVLEKMPVSITLGLWSTLIAYLISIPLGVRKAVRDGTPFDTWTSVCHRRLCDPGLSVRDPAAGAVRGGLLCAVVPAARPDSDNWEELSLPAKIGDYFWHITLPVWPRPSRLCHADAADQEQLSRRDQEAVRDDRPRQGPVRTSRAVTAMCSATRC